MSMLQYAIEMVRHRISGAQPAASGIVDSADYPRLLENYDQSIKSGKIATVSESLLNLKLMDLPRQFRRPLAKICRRVGQIELGLRILQPVVRSTGPLQEPATDEEVCEYAVLLSRNGCVDEAFQLLNQINASKCPEALLYLGFCHVSQWNYEAAAQFFSRHLEFPMDDYARMISNVNLAASLVATSSFAQAARLIDKVQVQARAHGALRLLGNCLELRAQVEIGLNDLDSAEKSLEDAKAIFTSANSYDPLLIEKWKSYIEALRNLDISPLIRFRSSAVMQSHWESVREADLLALRVKFDPEKYGQLVFGTPFQAYRDRVNGLLQVQPAKSFVLGSSDELVFDAYSGELNFKSRYEAPTQKELNVIQALLSDFYSPFNIGRLFSVLYAGEYFNVFSSPLRVHKALSRARNWIERNQLPMEIIQQNGYYKFHIEKKFGIRLHSNRFLSKSFQQQMSRLLGCFGTTEFDAQKACRALSISRSSFLRLVEWGLEHQLIGRSGIGKATRYQVLERDGEKPAAVKVTA